MNPDEDTIEVNPTTLPHEAYHLIVSPALQVAAELAAVRGDPELYNDMASMLALRRLVTTFGEFYARQYPNIDAATRQAIAAAPEAACTMVLQRAELDAKQLSECLWALDAAERQLAADAAFGSEAEPAQTAWQELIQGHRDNALARLKFAAGSLVTAIDHWERRRDAQAEASE